MNLWLRLFWIYARSLFAGHLKILEASTILLVTLPNDMDIYGHMNNGRYLTLMDLGRIDLIVRTGLGKASQSNRWSPLVGSVNIRYRRSLKSFQGFALRTRMIGWDEKWFYIEQTFWHRRKIVARALVQGLFRARDGNVPTTLVLRSINSSEIVSPSIPQGFAPA